MLGQRIKQLRQDNDITQKELADFLGVTPKAVSFYELGQRMPSNEMLLKLAQKFRVSTIYLATKKPLPRLNTRDTTLTQKRHKWLKRYMITQT